MDLMTVLILVCVCQAMSLIIIAVLVAGTLVLVQRQNEYLQRRLSKSMAKEAALLERSISKDPSEKPPEIDLPPVLQKKESEGNESMRQRINELEDSVQKLRALSRNHHPRRSVCHTRRQSAISHENLAAISRRHSRSHENLLAMARHQQHRRSNPTSPSESEDKSYFHQRKNSIGNLSSGNETLQTKLVSLPAEEPNREEPSQIEKEYLAIKRSAMGIDE